MTLDLDTLREGWDFEAKLAAGRDGTGQLPKSFWETYSAMANTHGGIILLGVKERANGTFKLKGINNPKKVERDLWNCLANREKVSCDLLDRDRVEQHQIEGKTILLLRIPRADRRQRPVYINNNPIKGTFVRTYEGDRRADEDRIRRMFSDASERPPDNEILKHFNLDDLEPDSLSAFRNLFKSNLPGHPFMAGNDKEMLRQLGGWSIDRVTGDEGLTLAGLLMFGRQRSILDRLPHYHLDFRHLPSSESTDAPRWLDRVTLDGTWSGNLFEYYRKVIPKLRDGLKIPFKMGPDLFRRDDTPQHEALREATVNTLIHADYMGRIGIRIFRFPHGFEFNNPGCLRLQADQIRSGGRSDCRNPSLQRMFQMIGAGEKAGSGFPKILQAWREQDWRAPALEENTEQEEICLRLTTLSLFPPDVTSEMERRFSEKMHLLNKNGRLALATAILEGNVTNERLQELTDQHPRDLTFLLKNLVKKGFLVVREKRRWSSYTLAPENSDSLPLKNDGLPLKNDGLPLKNDSLPLKNDGLPLKNDGLPGIVLEIRGQLRSTPDKIEKAILILCADRYVQPGELADILKRNMKTLKTKYISKLVREGRLVLRYPDQPTHPYQAYQNAETANKKTGD